MADDPFSDYSSSEESDTDQEAPSSQLIPAGVQKQIGFYLNAKRISGISGKAEKSTKLTTLIQEAKQYHSDQKFTEALIAYGQAIGLLHSIGTQQAHAEAAKILGYLIQVHFEWHPELASSEEALKSPKSCCAFALLHLLPDENDDKPDRQLLSSLGDVAEWLGTTTLDKYEDPETANTLFESIDMLARKTMMGELEHFMIIFKWASFCGGPYAKYSDDRAEADSIVDGWKAESLFSVAMGGFDSTLGRLHPQTIQCALSLSKMHLHHKKYLLAEAMCDYLYRAQLEAGHDTNTDVMTLHTLMRLVRCYMATKQWEKAGKLIWTFPRREGLPESSQVKKRWDEHYGGSNIRNQFRIEAAPYLFEWADEAISCLIIRRIEFKPSSLSTDHDREVGASAPRFGDGRGHFFEYDPNYKLQVVDDKWIDLTLPYVPYKEFLRHKRYADGYMYSFRSGFYYSVGKVFDDIEYPSEKPEDKFILKNAADRNRVWSLSLEVPSHLLSFYEGLTDTKQEDGVAVKGSLDTIPVWSPTEKSDATVVKGFLNGIPGDTALVQESLPYNLVSSRWVDYRRFPLHSANEAPMLSLQTNDGSRVTVLGYISGTWTDFEAEHQWNDVKLFVVDAIFTAQGSSEKHHFLFNPDTLSEQRRMQMDWHARRAFALCINPTLVIQFERVDRGTWGKPKPKVKKSAAGSYEQLYWEEMNRRELWDRKYENTFAYSEKEKLLLKQQKAAEYQARAAWDARFR